ncbi:hypothetical protein PR048_018942 [Dryococelus australis]|uniref:DDE Tnp4 domain-containing protein n=1 Tax=Dryococelus australis TaxID=614101 RepID=A0ABQ9H275_9NEOP|nr:hypothetical protein PR048_018942 [Dryococelus australis]
MQLSVAVFHCRHLVNDAQNMFSQSQSQMRTRLSFLTCAIRLDSGRADVIAMEGWWILYWLHRTRQQVTAGLSGVFSPRTAACWLRGVGSELRLTGRAPLGAYEKRFPQTSFALNLIQQAFALNLILQQAFALNLILQQAFALNLILQQAFALKAFDLKAFVVKDHFLFSSPALLRVCIYRLFTVKYEVMKIRLQSKSKVHQTMSYETWTATSVHHVDVAVISSGMDDTIQDCRTSSSSTNHLARQDTSCNYLLISTNGCVDVIVSLGLGSAHVKRRIGIPSETSKSKSTWPHPLECALYRSLTLRDPLGQSETAYLPSYSSARASEGDNKNTARVACVQIFQTVHKRNCSARVAARNCQPTLLVVKSLGLGITSSAQRCLCVLKDTPRVPKQSIGSLATVKLLPSGRCGVPPQGHSTEINATSELIPSARNTTAPKNGSPFVHEEHGSPELGMTRLFNLPRQQIYCATLRESGLNRCLAHKRKFHMYLLQTKLYPYNDTMRPYTGHNVSDEQIVFNYRLSSARMNVENTLARWRVYRRTIPGKQKLVKALVKATVCLYNWLLREEGLLHPEGRSRKTSYLMEMACVISSPLCGYSANAGAIREKFTDYFLGPGQLRFQWNRIPVDCFLFFPPEDAHKTLETVEGEALPLFAEVLLPQSIKTSGCCSASSARESAFSFAIPDDSPSCLALDSTHVILPEIRACKRTWPYGLPTHFCLTLLCSTRVTAVQLSHIDAVCSTSVRTHHRTTLMHMDALVESGVGCAALTYVVGNWSEGCCQHQTPLSCEAVCSRSNTSHSRSTYFAPCSADSIRRVLYIVAAASPGVSPPVAIRVNDPHGYLLFLRGAQGQPCLSRSLSADTGQLASRRPGDGGHGIPHCWSSCLRCCSFSQLHSPDGGAHRHRIVRLRSADQ